MGPGSLDTARSAARLAPADPQAHWSVATLEKISFSPEQLLAAVRHYEKAASLSPNDYRIWVDLGRTREQAGDRAGGEKALRRAVELAPAYAEPRWHLGNILLRQGRPDEAFAELCRAGDANTSLRPQIFNLAWTVYSQNVEAVKNVVGNSAEARAQLTAYLIGRRLIDDALQLWSSLSAAEKKEQRATGESLLQALLAAKRYHVAHNIFRELGPEDAGNAEIGQFINGGFENDVGPSAGVFSWQVRPVPQAQIAIDARTRHTGARSLRVVFNATSNLAFNNIAQLVAVAPATPYRLTFYVRTDDLKSAGPPTIEVLDSMNGEVLATSVALANGKSDWQLVTINFKTPAKTEAVTVRTSRASCGSPADAATAVCPIFGTVWYDDFNLQRSGGSAHTRDGSADKDRAHSSTAR